MYYIIYEYTMYGEEEKSRIFVFFFVKIRRKQGFFLSLKMCFWIDCNFRWLFNWWSRRKFANPVFFLREFFRNRRKHLETFETRRWNFHVQSCSLRSELELSSLYWVRMIFAVCIYRPRTIKKFTRRFMATGPWNYRRSLTR